MVSLDRVKMKPQLQGDEAQVTGSQSIGQLNEIVHTLLSVRSVKIFIQRNQLVPHNPLVRFTLLDAIFGNRDGNMWATLCVYAYPKPLSRLRCSFIPPLFTVDAVIVVWVGHFIFISLRRLQLHLRRVDLIR